MPNLHSDRVTKSFGSTEVLSEVTFSAEAGEVTFLAGRNGAGKTTWIRIALGMIGATKGSVVFGNGQSVEDVRSGLGVVFDEPPVYGNLDGHANLLLLSGVRHVPPAHYRSTCTMLDLSDSFLRMNAKSYSLGQRKRLAIAAALLREPKFLFLDEPTIGLDPIAWQCVRRALDSGLESGMAVILTGQDFNEIEEVLDHVAVLRDGRIVFEGAGEEFLARRGYRVRLTSIQLDTLKSQLTWPYLQLSERTVEVPCVDMVEARPIIEWARQASVDIIELSIVRDSLEDAFLAIHASSEKEGGVLVG